MPVPQVLVHEIELQTAAMTSAMRAMRNEKERLERTAHSRAGRMQQDNATLLEENAFLRVQLARERAARASDAANALTRAGSSRSLLPHVAGATGMTMGTTTMTMGTEGRTERTVEKIRAKARAVDGAVEAALRGPGNADGAAMALTATPIRKRE